MASTGELRNDDLVVEPDGSVVIASATQQPGNWLPLAPDSTMAWSSASPTSTGPPRSRARSGSSGSATRRPRPR